ncbi:MULTISPECIES: glycolate oxidase subunit GlcE [unclassified Polynucleobacter]|uniref:glycolate oxidase subunit GlcE n=1 Tax=unclassified Polynucleobacter TaxID=2640945 RepID=UPI0008BF77FF|nr:MULTISPECIES: glycolate oxidase subunit GlcE [unclassified Polynucleobacter]OHC10670.1 MAG: glycolate oxidase subunit GlcE [Polynucleobacter sp. GWA2_45_21]HBK44769.1 glycolate oxidase subunit GlcE [Polynucleobacter sp.]
MSTSNNMAIDLFREQILAAAKNKTPLSIEGGGTKSWYGNTNSYAKLDTRSYSGILEYQPEELVITACAGTPLKEIEAALAEKNQVLAFEPPHFGDNATFGGAIAAGLAGPGRISTGNLRDFVLGARIMDGKGQDLSFGGKVMKNVAGYDVSRLMPGSLGTLSLLLEASVKVLPKPAATATLRCQLSQEKTLRLLNEWAGQPLPLSASCWIGSPTGGDGELTIRLAGAAAAVKAAIPLMNAAIDAVEVDPVVAQNFWTDLREQRLAVFTSLNSTDTLYRLALPAACGPLAIENAVGDIALEWHGQQRWVKAPGDDATFASIKALANANGGHATRFKQGSSVDSSKQRFTLLSEQAHSTALEAVQARLRAAFDPAGVFATSRLP